MTLEKLVTDVEIVSQLGDQPNLENGLTSQELKAKFDEAAKIIKQYLNELVVPAVNEKLPAEQLNAAIDTALAKAKASGAFDGISVTHKWNGTTLIITSASGTSSADLKGDKGDKGNTGAKGAAGKDGVSPTITITTINGGHRVTVTDAGGTQSFNVMDGVDGAGGAGGANLAACSYATGTLPAGRAKGDVDGDGVVSEADATAIKNHSNGTAAITDEIALWAGDVDGDGYADSFDSSLIQSYLVGGGNYGSYAADYYGNWKYDNEIGGYYFDIDAPGMTADCGAIVIPAENFGAGFHRAIPMDGAMRLCFKACPVTEIYCRILYSPELSGVTVESGVENSFLDAHLTDADRAEITKAVLAALPAWDGGMY